MATWNINKHGFLKWAIPSRHHGSTFQCSSMTTGWFWDTTMTKQKLPQNEQALVPSTTVFYGGPSLTEFCGFLGPRVVTGPLFVVFILLVDLPVFGTWCLNFNFSRDSHGEIPMFIIVYLFSWNLMLKSHTYGCHDLKTWKNGPGIVSTAVSFRAIPWLAIPWVA